MAFTERQMRRFSVVVNIHVCVFLTTRSLVTLTRVLPYAKAQFNAIYEIERASRNFLLWSGKY